MAMRRVGSFFSFAAMFLLLGIPFTSIAFEKLVVDETGVGSLKLGMTLEAVKAIELKIDVDEVSPECTQVNVERTDDDTPLPSMFLVENGVVTRIYISEPAYMTAKGIGTGSSKQEIQAAYGSLLTVEPHHYADTSYYITLDAGNGKGFAFETYGDKVGLWSVGIMTSLGYVEGCL